MENHRFKLKIEEIERELYLHYEERRIKVENEAIDKMREDPGYFYSYAKKFSKDQNRIADLKVGDKMVVKDNEKADALQNQYKSVWSSPKIKVEKNLVEHYFSEC